MRVCLDKKDRVHTRPFLTRLEVLLVIDGVLDRLNAFVRV